MAVTVLANRQIRGITRSVLPVNTTTVAAGSVANVDYIYICNGASTVTLPTAIGNINLYTIKNTTGTVTINTISAQTIDGSTSIQLSVNNQSVSLISNGSNWSII